MESLYVLIPLSVGIVLAIIGILGWAINAGQFDDLEREGSRILADDFRETDPDRVAETD